MDVCTDEQKTAMLAKGIHSQFVAMHELTKYVLFWIICVFLSHTANLLFNRSEGPLKGVQYLVMSSINWRKV